METKRQNIDTGNTNEPQYVCTQNGTAKTTISKKEEKYTSNLKGTKLTILKKTEKNLLKNACFRHKEKRLITWEQTHIV